MKQIPDILQFFPCPESDELVVYFSAASANRLEGVRPLERFKVNKLFVRDPGRNWYNCAIKGLAEDADGLAAVLAETVNKFKREKVTFMGSSMGGYGALLLGSLLQVGKIRVAAPQIIIDPKVPHSPRVPVKYSDLTKVINQGEIKSDVKIWFGCGELLDVYQVARCQAISGCTIYAVPNALHNVLAHFKSDAVLPAFFDAAVLGTPFQYAYASLDGVPFAEIKEAMDCLFFEQNPTRSAEILDTVSHDLIDGARHFQIGSNWIKAGKADTALPHLQKAVEINPRNYEALSSIGSICMAQGNYAQAIKNYQLAIKHFPGKSADYLTQLAGSYRLNKDFYNALGSIEQALSISKYWKAQYHAGLIFRDMGRFSDAIQSFQDALAQKPDSSQAVAQINHCLKQHLEKETKDRFGLTAKVDVTIEP